jgi:hypothetical protein
MRKKEEGMMEQSSGQFVYHGILGVICRYLSNGSAIFSSLFRELAIQKVAKYGIGKWSIKLIFANILKFVIDIPLPGKIFSACFWTSCVGIVSVTISLRFFLINDDIYGCCVMNY